MTMKQEKKRIYLRAALALAALLVVLLALEALMVAGWMFTNSHGNHVDFYTGAGMLCVMLALGFYATLLTCDMVFADQYKNGTMKNEVSFEIGRAHV